MPKTIADFALLGDGESLAMSTSRGAIEWLAWPRFDSPSCFAAMLGSEQHGHFLLAPREPAQITRRYRPETLILETRFETAQGAVLLIDFMPPKQTCSRLYRIVRGLRGTVDMTCDFRPVFANGTAPADIDQQKGAVHARGAGNGLILKTTLAPEIFDGGRASFSIGGGDEAVFLLQPDGAPAPARLAHDAQTREGECQAFWKEWVSQCTYQGPYRDAVIRSLITIKALCYKPTGGIIAAATTSLPEALGGKRNWDYRFCWLRDSTFTVLALMHAGYRNEAREWTHWLIRALGGDQADAQPLYGITHERVLAESEAGWLPGFGNSSPVRFGNNAYNQFQLDLYGEVFDTIHHMRRIGEPLPAETWDIQKRLLKQVIARWQEPDAGIWEQRSDPEHFVQSRAMAWVALDCAIASVEHFGKDGPVEEWKRIRAQIHDTVCAKGFKPQKASFTRAFESEHMDAALLLLPLIGFLPPDDPRLVGTVAAIERELMQDGFVLRYDLDKTDDGLGQDKEGTFLACALWLADSWILQGRREDARELFERVLGAANDIGLFSEEYAPKEQLLLGNIPQGLTHLSLIHTAYNLAGQGPAHSRSRERDGRTDNAP